jgi:hypothetical protein
LARGKAAKEGPVKAGPDSGGLDSYFTLLDGMRARRGDRNKSLFIFYLIDGAPGKIDAPVY